MVGTKRRKIVFLCSGGGGNLCFIHDVIEKGWIEGADIVAVLTDRGCKANDYATLVGLENRSIDFSQGNQKSLLDELIKFDPDIIVTTVHKILSKSITDNFKGRLINLHYSILPAFGGMIGANSVKAAIDYGARFTGVTVHVVDERVDGGKPIVQGVIPLNVEEKNFDMLMNLVFRCGCLAMLAAIKLRLNAGGVDSSCSVEMMGKTCLFSGGYIDPLHEMTEEHFWQEIANKAKAV